MKYNPNIIHQAIQEVRDLFSEKVSDNYLYHSFDHSIEVMQNASFISEKTGLKEEDVFLVKLAGLFHDAGHVSGHTNHEEQSAVICEAFMKEHEFSSHHISVVCDAIRATKYPQSPKDQLSEVVCDADLFYLSQKGFISRSLLLLEEWKKTDQSSMPISRFYKVSLDFLLHHKYHTVYGQDVLQSGKERNISILRKKIEEASHS